MDRRGDRAVPGAGSAPGRTGYFFAGSTEIATASV